MKKATLLLAFALLTMLFVSGCAEKGTPPVLSYDGTDIVIGSSTMYDLEKNDFNVELSANRIAIGKVAANSWLQDFFVVEKGDDNYGYIYLYNPTGEELRPTRCTIYRVDIKMPDEDALFYKDALLNGISFKDMDYAAVKEAMSGYKESGGTENTSISYKDGDYTYAFYFDEETGIVERASAEIKIPKKY